MCGQPTLYLLRFSHKTFPHFGKNSQKIPINVCWWRSNKWLVPKIFIPPSTSTKRLPWRCVVNQLSIFYCLSQNVPLFWQKLPQNTNKNVDEGAIRDWLRKILYLLVHPQDDYLEDVWSTNSVSFMVFTQKVGQQTLEQNFDEGAASTPAGTQTAAGADILPLLPKKPVHFNPFLAFLPFGQKSCLGPSGLGRKGKNIVIMTWYE